TEAREVWYSRQLTDNQLKRLESLKAQQQQSKTSQLKRAYVVLNNCKSLRIWNMPLSWSDQDVRNVFSCFGEINRCQITDPTRKVVRLQKRARYVKKKTPSFLHDISNSDVVSSNLQHTDHVSTALSILDRFAVVTFTSSKSVQSAMHFDSSTIVQPFYQGSISLGKDKILSEYEHSRPKNLAEMEQQVDKFMFEFDRLTALRRKQYKENTPHRMRGWIQTKGEDGFKTIHYPSKFLRKKHRSIDLLNSKELADTYNDQPVPNIYDKKKHKEYYQLNNIKDVFAIKKARVMRQKNMLKSTEITKFGQGMWTKTIGENMGHRDRDQPRSKKTSSQPSSQSSHHPPSATSNREILNLLNPFRFCVDFLFVCYFGIELNCITLFYCILSLNAFLLHIAVSLQSFGDANKKKNVTYLAES
ncbi:hypothetical protein RFI_03063, partial [Reticulomyxa filosa]